MIPVLREKKHPLAGNAMKKSIGLAICGLVLGAAAHAETLKVDKTRSRIQVDAKATGHSFTGTLGDFTAKVSGDASSLAPTGFSLNWTFDHLKTGKEDRDDEMIKWLGGGKPAGSFRFTKSWKDAGGRTFAMGEITIHGIRKTISFPYTAKKDGRWVTIDGTASLNYEDFSLPIVRAMAVMTVDPQLTVRFHVVGKY
ncbi:YceI family protein [Haloferula helveola]